MNYAHMVCPSCDAQCRLADNQSETAKLKCPQCHSVFQGSPERIVLSKSIASRIVAFVTEFFYRLLTEKTSVATLTSLILHCALILFLGIFIVLPELQNGGGSLSLSAAALGPDSNELVAFDMMPAVADQQPESMSPVQPLSSEMPPPELSVDVSIDVPETLNIEAMVESMTRTPIDQLTTEGTMASAQKSTKDSRPKQNRPKSAVSWIPTISKKGIKIQEALLVTPKDGVRQSASASGAADRVMEKLRGSIGQDGPIAIVWLMDASLSLVEERRQLAPQVYSFYESLKANVGDSKVRPETSVFAFGQTTVQVARNLTFFDSKEIASAIQNLPIDQTGNENVLNALDFAIGRIPRIPAHLRIEVVIWTDESGDDLAMLEDAIQLCRYRNARVHVVGPLSVFGMEKGLQQYTLPEPYRWSVLLPVKRGPDSAFPERAQLPLWHESGNVDWGGGTPIPSSVNSGGPHRQLLLAPSGPYALTRLSLATGGSFTALNRIGDIAASQREQLFDYMPDYRSGWEIAYDIDKYPLRRAIIEAAALTGTIDYWPPQTRFPTINDDRFPYFSYSSNGSHRDFPKKLNLQLGRNVQKLLPVQQGIERAIQIMLSSFASNSVDSSETSTSDSTPPSESSGNEMSLAFVTPTAYKNEKSPRWRAWYDLNLGRLLAHSVRISEFIQRSKMLVEPQALNSMLNQRIYKIELVPSSNVIGGVEATNRANTAAALLERVLNDHPNTPWSDLAKWELQYGLGIEARFEVEPPPPPLPLVPVIPVPQLPPQPVPPLPRL